MPKTDSQNRNPKTKAINGQVIQPRGAGGRPREIPTETFKEVCRLTLVRDENGKRTPIKKACEIVGIDEGNFYVRCVSDEELAEFYARTRKAQSLADLEELGAIEDGVMDREIPPDVAKVVIGSKQWRMARLHRVLFGDQTQMDVNVSHKPDLSGLSDGALQEFIELRKQQLPGPKG